MPKESYVLQTLSYAQKHPQVHMSWEEERGWMQQHNWINCDGEGYYVKNVFDVKAVCEVGMYLSV